MLNCSINFHLGFYEMSVWTDSVDQDQTAQTVIMLESFINFFQQDKDSIE